MAKWLMAVLVAATMMTGGQAMAAESAHAFDFTSIDGAPMPMSQYRGKAVLVVNTASRCGFTPQYEGLQALWRDYRERGLVVLGVPSNDFGGQEPGSEAQIKEFCEVNFAVDFPMTEKVAVVGETAHPLYRWMASQSGGETPGWNFYKYLIDPEGRVVALFPSRVRPTDRDLLAAVEAVLPR